MNKDILVPLSEIEINPDFHLMEKQVNKLLGNPNIPQVQNAIPILSNLSNFDVVFLLVSIISFLLLKKYYRKFKFLTNSVEDTPKIPMIITVSIGLGVIGSYAYIKYNLKNVIGTFV
jgi:hypothetical protein